MAKMSSINKNNRRIKLSDRFYKKREKLKKIVMNKKLPLEERFQAQQKLSNYQGIRQKTELWIDAKLQVDLTVFIEN